MRVYSFNGDLSSPGIFTTSAVDKALPVTIVDFKGEHRQNINALSWSTVNELNNLGFEIQYSSDNKNFEKRAFINSKAINGNSSLALSYEFNDAASGNAYYRLKQIDKNSESAFSNIIYLKGDKVNSIAMGTIYPNPVKDKLNLSIARAFAE